VDVGEDVPRMVALDLGTGEVEMRRGAGKAPVHPGALCRALPVARQTGALTMAPSQGITAIVIDDSAVVRKHLSDLLTAGGIDVIATAAGPAVRLAQDAGALARRGGAGRRDAAHGRHHLPAQDDGRAADPGGDVLHPHRRRRQDHDAGAVRRRGESFVTKPKLGLRDFLERPVQRPGGRGAMPPLAPGCGAGGCGMRNTAAAGRRRRPRGAAGDAGRRRPGAGRPLGRPTRLGAMAETTDRVIAIGSSTGGVQAIESVLRGLPRTAAGHRDRAAHARALHRGLCRTRLNGLCEMDVKRSPGRRPRAARPGADRPGRAAHATASAAARSTWRCKDGPLVNRHKPSVDVLFRSVAHCAGRNAVGVI
jgi:two-component system chemotaxis response regulator CheB